MEDNLADIMSASAHPEPPHIAPQSRLLALPKELRLAIFELVVQESQVLRIGGPYYILLPSLLFANKQIRREASELYHKLNHFPAHVDGAKGLKRFLLNNSFLAANAIRKTRHLNLNFDFSPPVERSLLAWNRHRNSDKSVRTIYERSATEGAEPAIRDCVSLVKDLVCMGLPALAITLTSPHFRSISGANSASSDGSTGESDDIAINYSGTGMQAEQDPNELAQRMVQAMQVDILAGLGDGAKPQFVRRTEPLHQGYRSRRRRQG